jgi:hypothetical protein
MAGKTSLKPGNFTPIILDILSSLIVAMKAILK